MPQPQLFVAVSTGQHIANLPPLLEHAVPGDHVLWVESSQAKKNQWSQGPRSVLEKFGLRNSRDAQAAEPGTLVDVEVMDLNDPRQLVEALEARLDNWRVFRGRAFIIGNGGVKFTPIGLLQGLRPLDPVLLYGDDKPVCFRKFTQSFTEPPEIAPYRKHELDLPHILAAAQRCIANPEEAVRFWPGPLPPQLEAERYGRDPDWARNLHAEHHAWADRPQPSEQIVVPYGKLADCFGDSKRLTDWKETIRNALGRQVSEKEGAWSTVYHATLNLNDAAARACAAAGVTEPSARIGHAFERAVARRVYEWLESGRSAAVKSAWLNVKVNRSSDSKRMAEFDVLLVLKNGILWHLECKISTVDFKDLDARLLNLQLAGSQLAQMVICLPIFTAYAGEKWFATSQKLRELIEENWGSRFLPFTLAGQPESYMVPDAKDTSPLSCPPFEIELEKLLKPYNFQPSATTFQVPAPATR